MEQDPKNPSPENPNDLLSAGYRIQVHTDTSFKSTIFLREIIKGTIVIAGTWINSDKAIGNSYARGSWERPVATWKQQEITLMQENPRLGPSKKFYVKGADGSITMHIYQADQVVLASEGYMRVARLRHGRLLAAPDGTYSEVQTVEGGPTYAHLIPDIAANAHWTGDPNAHLLAFKGLIVCDHVAQTHFDQFPKELKVYGSE